jgi:HEAT repeat protein
MTVTKGTRMARIGWLLGVLGFCTVLLLVPGCEQPASLAGFDTPAGANDVDLQIQAYRIIMDALADADPQVRANAVEVVATTRAVRLLPKIQKLLADSSVPVRFAAALAVGDLEYALARNDIARLLLDENPNVKIAASYAMFRLGQPEYYRTICGELANEDQTVRANAALVLGKCGRQEGLRFLWWALAREDSADKVTLQATESIAMLKDPRILKPLWSQLISAYADDRVLGIRGMGALGTDEAKNALVTMLDNKVPEVRLAAAEQLGRLGEPIGEPNVAEVFEKNLFAGLDVQGQQRLKVFAALAVGEIGTPALTRYLPPLLQDPFQPVRLAAAKAALRSLRHAASPQTPTPSDLTVVPTIPTEPAPPVRPGRNPPTTIIDLRDR